MPDISDPQDLSRFSSMPDWLKALYGVIGHNKVDMGGDQPLDRGISPPQLQEGRSVSTSSGYLPDWLQAALGQGGVTSNAPVGLFSDTAARGSPTPNIGLLSSLPQFTGVEQNAPAFQGGNAPNGPLPDQSPTFSYMGATPPWGGSGPSNSYPSMTMPQDPGPMNIGPGGAVPSFAGVSPNAPFTANGPTAVQDQYANVPLPPRRPNDLTSFQATTAGDPTDINTPPPSQPNANVIGTPASGAPEAARSSPGLGDYLGKAANAIGGIYGAGGPGDALIAMGLSNRTGGASIQALNAITAQRNSNAMLAYKQAEANDKLLALAGNIQLVKKALPGVTDAQASAYARNPAFMQEIGKSVAPSEQWTPPSTDEITGNIISKNTRTGETKILQAGNETFHPSTDAEKAAAGINPKDPTPYQTSDRTQKITPIGGPATAVTVNNAPELTYQGELTKPIVAEHAALIGGVPQAQERLRNLNAMSGALQSIRQKGDTTGLGTETKTMLQGYVNTLANSVGMQPFDISDKEMINKFGRLMAAQAAQNTTGARVTNFELNNFLKANPGLELSPQGNERLLGIMQQIEQRNLAVGQGLRKRTKFSPQENDDWINQYDQEHHIKDPITGQDITANPKLPGFSSTTTTTPEMSPPTATPKFNWRRVGP